MKSRLGTQGGSIWIIPSALTTCPTEKKTNVIPKPQSACVLTESLEPFNLVTKNAKPSGNVSKTRIMIGVVMVL